MAPRKRPSAFDLTDAQIAEPFGSLQGVAQWLCTEIDAGLEARSGKEREIGYAWKLYEQQRTRARLPWPGAADLTSPIAAEFTDALHARLMTTVFTEPVWTVEGWGASAAKAPFVEEFHQRAQEDERLQTYIDPLVLRALVEGVGTLEVSEAVEMRREKRTIRAAVQLDAEGRTVIGTDGQPVLQRHGGQFVEVPGDDASVASAEIDIEESVPERVGPAYDVIPYLDFLTLPAHARDRSQVWGYAKRFYRRVGELKARVRSGMYDQSAVEELGDENERYTRSDEAPSVGTIATQHGPTAQKELYEVQCLADFDGKGERWWRATVHKDKVKLLRLKVDDRITRFIRVLLFPRPETVDRGYSLITDKMITVIEQDTAVNNMWADRASLKASQPVLRQTSALWDPYEQPMGPGAVIDVRDMNEIRTLQGIDDVGQGVILWKANIRNTAERLIGQNDIAQGQDTDEARTLGEVQLQASYAEVRMNVLLRRLQESLEELFQARHTIWMRTLQQRGGSLPISRALVIGREAQGIEVSGLATDGTITADLLDGVFWGKPRGSVETADLNMQRRDFNSSLETLAPLMQVNPMIGMIFQTPTAAKALVKTWLKVNRVQDIQSFIGTESNDVFAQMAAAQQQQQLMQDPRMKILQMIGGMSQPGPMEAGAAPAGEAPVPMPGGSVQ